ncbi:MAG TPA: hypothetical protein VLW06_08125 [Terriglobales bacterium]|nr:hypothetical protein [Terriglobales bacterium]
MKRIFLRATGSLLILILSGTTEVLLAQQQTPQPPPPAQNAPLPPVELPESPGSNTSSASQNMQAPPPQTSGAQSQTPKQPSGTAVAPAIRVSGGAASEPAGAAIAPPKQHQVRSWLIRFGFIAGAGAALGTVAALSAASPSRVPGSPH